MHTALQVAVAELLPRSPLCYCFGVAVARLCIGAGAAAALRGLSQLPELAARCRRRHWRCSPALHDSGATE